MRQVFQNLRITGFILVVIFAFGFILNGGKQQGLVSASGSFEDASAYLLKDINSNPAQDSLVNGANEAVEVGNTVYFTNSDSTNGTELWKTDGTSAGTSLVRDVNLPSYDASSVYALTNFNNTLYFVSYETEIGWYERYVLWKTDGTAAGTVPIKALPGGILQTKVHNGSLYILTGTGLWKSDGTEAGTTQIYTFSGMRAGVHIFNNQLFFMANDGTHGFELWKSDGTAAGTSLVADITSGSASSTIEQITVFNNELYFRNTATNPQWGKQLWKTDGTSAGTQQITTNPFFHSVESIVVSDNKLYASAGTPIDEFTHSYGLWVSTNGTNFTSVTTHRNNAQHLSPEQLTDVDGALFFTYYTPSSGIELWKTNGTEASTQAITDISLDNSADSKFVSLTAFKGQLFFDFNGKIWVSNGTTAGTKAFGDFINATSSYLVSDSFLFFSAFQGNENIKRLWITDGSPAGTYHLSTAHDKTYSSRMGINNLYDSLVVGNTLYFAADTNTRSGQLWKTDGTTAGTVHIPTIANSIAGGRAKNFIEMNGILYFTLEHDSYGEELWRSDGTEAGTYLVKDINLSDSSNIASRGSQIRDLAVINNTLFFTAKDEIRAYVWKSDGTEAGTVIVKDLSSFSGNRPEGKIAFNNEYYFSLYNWDGITSSYSFWKTDGTDAGTIKLLDAEVIAPVIFDNTLFFTVNDPVTNTYSVWSSDGTIAGTQEVSGLNSIVPSGANGLWVQSVFDNKLVLSSYTNSPYQEYVWLSDGTAAGTQLLSDIYPGIPSTIASDSLIKIGSRSYFWGGEVNSQWDLWTSDGTTAGTYKLTNGNYNRSFLGHMTQFAIPQTNSLAFTNYSPEGGVELWITDGTVAGTRQWQNIGPGAQSSSVAYVQFVNDRIVFTADDNFHGYELWVIDPSAPAPTPTVTLTPTATLTPTPTMVAPTATPTMVAPTATATAQPSPTPVSAGNQQLNFLPMIQR
jgi:ELWxxDGT repeat protein